MVVRQIVWLIALACTPACTRAHAAWDLPRPAGVWASGMRMSADDAARARFLTYDVSWGEQFNFRKSALRAALALVRALHASDPSWVLVLPPFKTGYHDTHEWAPWRAFFDVAAMREQLFPRILEFDEYVQLIGPRIDGLIKESACGPRDSGLLANTARSEYLFGVKLQVGGVGCHAVSPPVLCTDTRLHDALRRMTSAQTGATLSAGGARSLALDYFDKIHADDHRAPYWPVRRGVRFAPVLEREARSFLHRELPVVGDHDGEGDRRDSDDRRWRPFVSLHFRRADFVRAHADVMSSVEQVAAMVQRTCAERGDGTRDAVIATDTSDEELGALRQALGKRGVRLHRFAAPTAARPFTTALDFTTEISRLQIAKIDQLVTSLGDVFVGTARSHFSKEIHLERRLRLHARLGQREGENTWFRTSRALVGQGKLIPLCGDPALKARDDEGGDETEVEFCEMLPTSSDGPATAHEEL